MQNTNIASRYSIEDVNTKLSHRKIRCVSEYINSKTKTTFQCHYGHNWVATPASVISGKGCPTCAGNRSLTKDIVNERLRPQNIILISEYTNNATICTFRCVNGHEWNDVPRNVLQRKGCILCNPSLDKKKIKQVLNAQLRARGLTILDEYVNLNHPVGVTCDNGHTWKSKPYTILKLNKCSICHPNKGQKFSKDYINELLSPRNIQLIGEYKNSASRTEFKCEHGHEWYAFPSSVIGGTGCPSCAKYGFRQDISATLYVIKYPTFIKYGISNDVERRLRELSRNGTHQVILLRNFASGKEALELETKIKRKFNKSRILSKVECPDGYTETLGSEHTDELLFFINENVNNSSV